MILAAYSLSPHIAESAVGTNDQLFRQKVNQLKGRYKDFYQRQKVQAEAERRRQEAAESFSRQRAKTNEEYEKARRRYVAAQKAKQPIDEIALKRAYEAKEAQEEQRYNDRLKNYQQKQESLRRIEKNPAYMIPEDQDVGLDYSKM